MNNKNYSHTKEGIIFYPENINADKKALYEKMFNGDKKARQRLMSEDKTPGHYQILDIFRKIKEWKYEDYDETGNPEHTEDYNGFRIEVRFSCQCDIYENAECGLKFFVITANNRYFTNSYLYHNQISACNNAYEAIDNGEIPE